MTRAHHYTYAFQTRSGRFTQRAGRLYFWRTRPRYDPPWRRCYLCGGHQIMTSDLRPGKMICVDCWAWHEAPTT